MGREKPSPVVLKEPCCKCGATHEKEEVKSEPAKFEDAQETIPSVVDPLPQNIARPVEPHNAHKRLLQDRLMHIEQALHRNRNDAEILDKKGIKIAFDTTKARLIKPCVELWQMVEWCDVKEKLWKITNSQLVPAEETDLIEQIKEEAKEWEKQVQKLYRYIDWLVRNWVSTYSINHVALAVDDDGLRYSELEYFIERVDDAVEAMKSEKDASSSDYLLGFQKHKDAILSALEFGHPDNTEKLVKDRTDAYTAFERQSIEIDIMDSMRQDMFEDISSKMQQILLDFDHVTVPKWLVLVDKIIFPKNPSHLPPPQSLPPQAPFTYVVEERPEKKDHVCTSDKIICVINDRLGDPVNMWFIMILFAILLIELKHNPLFFLTYISIILTTVCYWYNANWGTLFPEKGLKPDPKK